MAQVVGSTDLISKSPTANSIKAIIKKIKNK